jgi:hypothetical protein
VRRGLAVLLLLAAAVPAGAQTVGEAFRAGNDALRAGDAPRAIAMYARLAAAGEESAALYWNWAQAAATRGAHGEALWALLRAREVEPGDAAVSREIDRRRAAIGLDEAEVEPEPLTAAARLGRWLHLDLLALLLGVVSLVAHVLARARPASRAAVRIGWAGLALALAAAAAPAAGAFARGTAVVVARGAPLLDAASPTAAPVGTLREGEVVPVLDESGAYLRLEDSSGARGWSLGTELRRLDERPRP